MSTRPSVSFEAYALIETYLPAFITSRQTRPPDSRHNLHEHIVFYITDLIFQVGGMDT